MGIKIHRLLSSLKEFIDKKKNGCVFTLGVHDDETDDDEEQEVSEKNKLKMKKKDI